MPFALPTSFSTGPNVRMDALVTPPKMSVVSEMPITLATSAPRGVRASLLPRIFSTR